MFNLTSKMIDAESALPGRSEPVSPGTKHFVHGTSLEPPFARGLEQAVFAMGCFWGAERRFWTSTGIYTTAAGYCGGFTPNPTYEEISTGRTGHAEAVLIVFDPDQTKYDDLLRIFWEAHDPTQGMRQGNDSGTQYRSGIYTLNAAQESAAKISRDKYQRTLNQHRHSPVTTEIVPLVHFYYAEDYHQQYLAKNPGGYCGLSGTGVAFPGG